MTHEQFNLNQSQEQEPEIERVEEVSSEATDQPKDSLLGRAFKKIKTTAALGLAVGAGYVGNSAEAADIGLGHETKRGQHTEQKATTEVINSAFITNFLSEIKKEALEVALSDDHRVYSRFVDKMQAFHRKITFTDLSTEEKETLAKIVPQLKDLSVKIKVRMAEISEDMQRYIDDLESKPNKDKVVANTGMTAGEIAGMRIRQDKRIIGDFAAMAKKLDRIQFTE